MSSWIVMKRMQYILPTKNCEYPLLTDNVRLIGNLIHSTFWQHFVSKAFFCDWRCNKKWRSTPKPNFMWRAPWVYDVYIISVIRLCVLCSHFLRCKDFQNDFTKHFSFFILSKSTNDKHIYAIIVFYIFIFSTDSSCI